MQVKTKTHALHNVDEMANCASNIFRLDRRARGNSNDVTR